MNWAAAEKSDIWNEIELLPIPLRRFVDASLDKPERKSISLSMKKSATWIASFLNIISMK